MENKNILLIMCDQLRADALGCYGNRTVKTPWMDSLAEEGVLFRNAYTQTPVCVPARYGLLAGQNPCRMGIWENITESPDVRHPFPELLGRAGYATCSVGKMHFNPARAPHGFQKRWVSEEVPEVFEDDDYLQFLDQKGYGDIDEPHGERNENYYVPQISSLPPELHTTAWTGIRSCEYIRKNKKRKFCMVTSFIKPHPPFDPAERYLELYQEKKMEGCLEGTELTGLDLSIWVQNGYKMNEGSSLPEKKLKEIKRHYYASITQIDEQIGNVIKELKESGLYENTVIIFTADHGEMLGDHQCVGKRCFYDGSARIPMIIRVPGAESEGRICDELVTLEDVYATILDIGGVTIPQDCEGVSLLPCCRDVNAPTHEYIFGGQGNGPLQKYFLMTKDWKYTYYVNGGQEALFDRKMDPEERHNAASEQRELCAQLKRTYMEWIRRNEIPDVLEDGELKKINRVEQFRVGFLNQSPRWRETK